MNQCYRLSAGRLLMASSFNLSTARVYFSVCFSPLWPSSLATVLMLAPLLRMFTAKEWRAQCQLMCLSMPARFTHRLTDLQQLSYDGRLKTSDSFVSPSFGLPTRWMSPSLRGMVTQLRAECPLILSCLARSEGVCWHSRYWISLRSNRNLRCSSASC